MEFQVSKKTQHATALAWKNKPGKNKQLLASHGTWDCFTGRHSSQSKLHFSAAVPTHSIPLPEGKGSRELLQFKAYLYLNHILLQLKAGLSNLQRVSFVLEWCFWEIPNIDLIHGNIFWSCQNFDMRAAASCLHLQAPKQNQVKTNSACLTTRFACKNKD